MGSRSEELITEIKEITRQYESEVGTGKRRSWPLSIRERVWELKRLGGGSWRQVSQQSGVPYHTILNWRYRERHSGGDFKEIEIVSKALVSGAGGEISKVGTVTIDGRVCIAGLSISGVVQLVEGLRR